MLTHKVRVGESKRLKKCSVEAKTGLVVPNICLIHLYMYINIYIYIYTHIHMEQERHEREPCVGERKGLKKCSVETERG